MRLATLFLAGAGLALALPAQATVLYQDDFDSVSPTFATDYTYVAPSQNAGVPEGVYTIAADPSSVHPFWVSFANGSGNALVVNGATNKIPSLVFQGETVTATQSGLYTFSASVANICCNPSYGPNLSSPSLLDFFFTVNGATSVMPNAVFSTLPGGPVLYPDAGIFSPVTASLFLNAGDTFGLGITNNTNVGTNDFAIDNIAMTIPSIPSVPVISAVPEPALWAMMLLGFGAVGFAMRGSRRRGAIAAA